MTNMNKNWNTTQKDVDGVQILLHELSNRL
ncbi:hypothetical protein RHT_00902 [Candidatus Rhabdochlamydia sp. T3358]|jgi:hypothetical protein|nr:hypothetical protein RHT_00902 [Candidatus Rhabdochlamydia sp. T3358]